MKVTKTRIAAFMIVVVALAVLAAACAAARPTPTPASGAPVGLAPTATRTRSARPTSAPAEAGPTATPVIAPTAITLATLPPPTPVPSSTPSPAPASKPVASTGGTGASAAAAAPAVPIPWSAPSLNPAKYPAPALVTPGDNAVFHVSQPLVHFVWTNTPTDLLTYGPMAQCQSDTTTERHTLEVNQIVIHSLDNAQPDIVGWMDTGTDYYLNLTTVPAGRYSWSVNVGVICQSHLIGRAYDLPQHKSTMERVYLGPVSPSSPARTLDWIP